MGRQSAPAKDSEQAQPTDNIELQHLQHLLLSQPSSGGFDGVRTMKLIGRISDYKVVTMIDSGTSHCFISEHVARKLNLLVDMGCRFTVTLGNGHKITTTGLCWGVSLYLYAHKFYVDCFVFPLGGVDVISGVSWLATLGTIKAK